MNSPVQRHENDSRRSPSLRALREYLTDAGWALAEEDNRTSGAGRLCRHGKFRGQQSGANTQAAKTEKIAAREKTVKGLTILGPAGDGQAYPHGCPAHSALAPL